MVYENLKAAIKQAIKQNGNQEITGNLLQSTLLNIVNTLGADYKFLGFASPSTVPLTSEEGRLFYFASEAGEYVNFPTTGENTWITIGEGLCMFTKEADSKYWKAYTLIEILRELGTNKDKVLSQRESSLIASYNSEVINYRTENTKGFLSSTNTFINTEAYVSKTTGYIKVKEGDVYLYKGISRSGAVGCLVFDKDFKVIKTFQAESESDYVEFVMPENAYCARFSSFVPTGSDVILEVIPKNSVAFKLKNSVAQELGTNKDKVLSQRESSLIASYNSEVINYRTENTKGFLSSTNTFINTEAYVSKTTGYIKVKEGDVYLYRGISRDNGFGCLVFNKDFKVIKTFKAESESDYVEFVMPENAYCARFSSFVPTGSNVILDVIPKNSVAFKLKNSVAQELGTDIDKVLSQRESSLIASYNSEVINYRTENTKGFLSSTNTFINTEAYVSKTTGYIKVKEGDVYLYRGISRGNGFGCLVFNKDFKVIKTFKAESESDYTEFVMPENAYCARFSSFSIIGSDVILEVIPKNSIAYTNNLSFKKWIACGDSFTHGDFTGYDGEQLLKATFDYGPYSGRLKVYPFYIGNRVKNFIVKNEAKNGLTLRDFVKNETYKSICETYNRIDYITLYFGINDDHQNVTIGTIDDTLGDNTFYGYWNTLLTYLVTNFTNTRIGIIVSNGLGSSEYSKAERAVAKKYGIPYLDFAADEKLPYLIRQNERSDISPAIKKIKEDYFAVSSTNRHPNEKAHSIESEFIEQFLLSL